MGPVRADDAKTGAPAAEEPGSGPGVPAQEEGVHQMSGESSGRAREPEQGLDRGAQIPQRAVLQSESGLRKKRKKFMEIIIKAAHASLLFHPLFCVVTISFPFLLSLALYQAGSFVSFVFV